MHGRERRWTNWQKVLETAAWRMAVGMPLILISGLLVSNLVMEAMLPQAATVALVPSWRLAWHSLAWDDRYPTPPAGSYCDATLSAYRLQIGPLEIRYSSAY